MKLFLCLFWCDIRSGVCTGRFILKMSDILHAVFVSNFLSDLYRLTWLPSKIDSARILHGAEQRAASVARLVDS